MSLHPNEQDIRALNSERVDAGPRGAEPRAIERLVPGRRGARRALLAVACLWACCALAAPARADDEDLTAAEIEAQITEISGKANLSEADLERLVELGQLYVDAVAREGGTPTADGPKQPAPTARPVRTPRPTPTPRPTTSRSRRGAGTTDPTPAPTPRPRGRRGGATESTAKTEPAPAGENVEVTMNPEAERFSKPYDERIYEFSIKDGTYAQLVETFGRMASLPVVGAAPAGNVSFVSSEKMDFKTALGRVQMLLYNHTDKYWLLFKEEDKLLEIIRIVDIRRVIPLNRIFPTLAEYRAANLDDNDIALLLYTPESGSIAELEPLRDFMPDYFMTSQFENKNSQIVFGVVADINKYLALIDKFRVGDQDPRITKFLRIQFVKPSAALAMIQQLVEFGPTEGAPANRRRAGQASPAQVIEYGVTAIADDDRGTILVRAMPKKIEEIERFLQFVDLPLDEEAYVPVIVRVHNTDAGKVMELVKSILNAGSGSPSPAAKATGAAARRRAAAQRKDAAAGTPASAAAPLQSDSLTMLHWQPANSIILIGAEEEIASARELIERFDVADEISTEFVEAKFRTAEDVCSLTTALLQASFSGQAPQTNCMPQPNGHTIILAGPTREVARAKDIIASLDVDSGEEPETIHTAVLECMTPTAMVAILSAWDATETPGAAAAPAPAAQGKRSTRRSTPQRAAAGIFHPDDPARKLRVICTDADWEERYQPEIARLDAEECGDPQHIVIKVEHVAPEDAIATLNSFFAGDGKGAPAGPTLVPVPAGFMVLNATPTDLATMKQVLAEIDVDPIEKGLLERRTFELTHVEPSEIIPVLQALTDSGAPAPAPRRRGRNAAPAPTTGGSVAFVDYGNRIWVSAPPTEMTHIADLIAELDVPETDRELRPYVFEAGTNVVELAETLRTLFPDNGRVAAPAPAEGATRRTRRTRAAATVSAEGNAILFIPQPTMRRIFVSAPVDMFDDIEATIELVRPESGPQRKVVVKFYPLEKSEPQSVAEIVEPIAQMRIGEMIDAGELPAPGKDAGTLLRITPDAASNRLVVAAPTAVIPEIEELIAQVEAGDVALPVVRTVQLLNSSATEVAEVLGKLIGSGSAAPTRRFQPPGDRGGRRGRGREQAQAPTLSSGGITSAVTPSGVTVIPLPSDDTLMVRGPEPDVEEVIEWIGIIDDESNKGMKMAVYQPAVDVETLADEIMTVFDSGGAAAAPAKSESDDLFDFDISMGGPRRGTDIRLTTNYYTNTMVIWATPRMLAQIDEYISLYETGAMAAVDEPPGEIIELIYADAFDAKYDLQDVIDTTWSGEKPKIDYVSFTNAIVVKSRNLERDVPRVKELIAQYIDTPDKADAALKVEHAAVSGGPVTAAVAELITRVSDKVEIEVEGLVPDKDDSLLETLSPMGRERRQITPCVLPAALTRAMDALAVSALGQAAGAADADTNGGATLEELVRERVDQPDAGTADAPPVTQEGPTAHKPAESAKPKAPPAETATSEKPKVKIKVDTYSNSVTISGAPRDVESVKDVLDDIMEEIQEASSGAPDIRVWVLEYLDPTVAAQVLENMFNASSPQSRAAQMQAQLQAARAAQLQAARQRQQQQQQQQQQKPGEQGGRDGNEREGRGRQNEEEQQPEAAQPQQQGGISVFPYPPLHAIIVKAPTEMYPALERLVATIDRKTGGDADFRYFHVRSQSASDVEAQLKVIFNIDQPSPATARRAVQRGRNANVQAQQQVDQFMQQQIDLAALGDEGAALSSTTSITITSNDATNTVLVRGPLPVLDLAEEIIAKIEANAPEPIEPKTYTLKFADAATVVPQLKEIFPQNKETYHPDDVQAIFLADTLNNAVFVKARASDFTKIEEVINQLDVQSGPQEKALTITVNCGDAEKFAGLLGKIYGLGRGNASAGAKKIEFVGDAASNTLVFTAPEELRQEIKDQIARLDQTACDLLEPRFLTLASATPTTVAKVIEQAFSGSGKGGASRVKVSGDDATRQLIITAPEETLPQIEKFAKTLDVPPTLDVRTFQLKFAKASEVLLQMEQMFTKLAMQLRGQGVPIDTFAGTASDRPNTITVAGGPMTFAAVEKFLTDVDVPAQDKAIGSMVVVLKKTDAREVADMVRRLFPRAEDGIDPPRVEANDRTNTLVVFGTQAQRDRIQNEVINKLEEIAAPQQERENRVYVVTYADLNDVRNAINTAFRLERGANESERVEVAIENATRSVVVNAKPDKLDKVAELIKQLDVPATFAPETRTFKLQYADAGSTRETIMQLYAPRGGRRVSPSDEVTAVVDWGANAVIVSTGAVRMQEIATFIESLDVSGQGARQVHVVTLQHVDAASAVRSLQEMFAQRGRGNQETVSISSPQGSDALLIKANAKEFAEISEVIKNLDVLPSGEARESRMFTLKYTNPDEMQAILEDYLARPGSNRGGRRGNAELVGDMTITTMPSSNSIVATGNAEQLERVAALVARIDVEVADAGNAPKIIQLEKAIASDIEPTLTQIFIEGADRRSGRQGSGAQITPVIVANDYANTLIVRASPTDFTLIENLVKSLDLEESDPKGRFEIVQVASAFRVADLATTIEETVRQASFKPGDTGRGGRGGRGGQSEFTAQPIEASNTLVLAGDPKQIQVAKAMIDQIQSMGPAGGKTTKIIPLGGNRNPEEIKRVLEEMINNNKSQGSSGRSTRGGRR